MKKLLLSPRGPLIAARLVSAKVIANFNSPVDTECVDFVAGSYAHGQQHGTVGLLKVSTNGAWMIIYCVFIPGGENFPHSLRIDISAEDKTNYMWEENESYAMNIPKGEWYFLSLPPASILFLFTECLSHRLLV